MSDLFLATQVAPATLPTWAAVAGIAAVILTMLAIAWRAGHTLATKEDLKENRRQIQQVDGALRRVQNHVAFMLGRQRERDHQRSIAIKQSMVDAPSAAAAAADVDGQNH